MSGNTYFGFDIDKNEYLREVLGIHFDNENGTKYWLKREKKLGLNVKKDINDYGDLRHLGFSNGNDLRKWKFEDLIPKKFLKGDFIVGESSGTTGPVKLVPWHRDVSDQIVDWYLFNLDCFKIPEGENWVSIAPCGLYKEQVKEVARRRGGLYFFMGIEPRGLKRAMEHASIFRPHMIWYLSQYMKPIFENLEKIFATQDIGVMTTGPQITKQMHEAAKKHDSVENIKGIITSGLATSAESIEEAGKLFPNARIMPMYANIFWGPAFNHPQNKSFVPEYYGPEPIITFDVVDPDTKEKVKYGRRGQVMFHRVDKGFFWPNSLERDEAERIAPKDPYPWDGVKDIRAFIETKHA